MDAALAVRGAARGTARAGRGIPACPDAGPQEQRPRIRCRRNGPPAARRRCRGRGGARPRSGLRLASRRFAAIGCRSAALRGRILPGRSRLGLANRRMRSGAPPGRCRRAAGGPAGRRNMRDRGPGRPEARSRLAGKRGRTGERKNKFRNSRFLHRVFTEKWTHLIENRQNKVRLHASVSVRFLLTLRGGWCILEMVPRGSRNSEPKGT